MENTTVCICPVTLVIIEEIPYSPVHMFAEESPFAEAIFFDPKTGDGLCLDFGHSENRSVEAFEDLLRTNFLDIYNFDLSAIPC